MKLFQTQPDLVVKNRIFLFVVSYFYFSFCHLVLPFAIYLHRVFIIFFPISLLSDWTSQASSLFFKTPSSLVPWAARDPVSICLPTLANNSWMCMNVRVAHILVEPSESEMAYGLIQESISSLFCGWSKNRKQEERKKLIFVRNVENKIETVTVLL